MLCKLRVPVLLGAGAPSGEGALCLLDHARDASVEAARWWLPATMPSCSPADSIGGCVSRTGAIVGASYRIGLTATQAPSVDSIDGLVTYRDTSSSWGTSAAGCDVGYIQEPLFAVRTSVARRVAVRCLVTGSERPWSIRTLGGASPRAAAPAAAWARRSGQARRLVRRHARDADGVLPVGEPYGSTPQDRPRSFSA
jgi:hypothetical protein